MCPEVFKAITAMGSTFEAIRSMDRSSHVLAYTSIFVSACLQLPDLAKKGLVRQLLGGNLKYLLHTRATAVRKMCATQ